MCATRHCKTRQTVCKDGGTDSIQCGPIVPYWSWEIAAHGVHEDLVVVELEDDIGKPPVPLPLEAFTVAGGPPWCLGRGIECLLDHLWDLHARGKREAAACDRCRSVSTRGVVGRGTHRRRCEW